MANKGSNNISVLLNRKFRFGNMSGMFGNFTSAVNTPAPGAPASFASLSTISAPSGIASGVFTNLSSANNPVTDRRAGLAVANSGNNTVAILLPGGGGTFILPQSSNSPQRLTAGAAPSAIKTADFNKDGKTDIAVCNQDDNSVTVFLGNGDGTFGDGKGTVVSQTSGHIPYPVGNGPVSMVLGDFNTDGILDIAVANKDSGHRLHPVGQGRRDFLQGQELSGGGQPFVYSGRPRAATWWFPSQDGTATILNNNGSGAFTLSKKFFTVGASPAGVLAEDVTDDRIPDIVTANSGTDTITLITRNATGGFDPPVDFPAGTGPVALAAHDFNGDGATDLAVADSGGGVTILFGRDIATLTVNITGSGTVSVQSRAEGTQTATASSTVFQEEGGRELVLTPIPADASHVFSHWAGDLTGSKNPDFLEMNTKLKTVTAVFRSVP